MIADKIKLHRESLGLTQTELAKRLGVTRSSENAWEQGISCPSVPYIIELAGIFGVSTDYLLGVKGNESFDVSGLNEEERRLVYELIKYFEKRK